MAKKKKQDQTNNTLLIGIISVVAVAVVAVLVLVNRPRTSTAAPTPEGVEPGLDRGVTENGDPYLGDPNAPVTMVIYEDLGCHNCKAFFETVEPLVLANYVASGRVRLEIYTVAFVNQASLPGAEAAYCALDQGRYWEMREQLFANQGVVAFSRANFIKFAENVGMDVKQFTSCYDLGNHTKALQNQSSVAYNFGITGTPTIEIAGKRHVGVLPFENENGLTGIKQLLDEALAGSGK